MRTEITPGQTSDYLGFDLVMVDNLPEPSVLLADRGYDADSIREKMEVRHVLTQIPMRKSRKMRVGVDHSLYSLRNLVERCFNKLKNARRVATRYDKTAQSFLGFIDITSIRLWILHSPSGVSFEVKIACIRALDKDFLPQAAPAVAQTAGSGRIRPRSRCFLAQGRRFSAQRTDLSSRFRSV